MKCIRLVMLCVLLTVGMTATAFAAKGDKEVDFTLGFATAPYGSYDLGWGFDFGGGYEFFDNFTPGISGDTLQLRGDVGYHTWSASESGVDVTASRVPVTVSCRYYFPIRQVKNLRVFGQAGLEVSFDDVEASVPAIVPGGSALKVSASSTNVGVTPGAGVEYMLNRNFFLTANMKEHIISDSYFAMQAGIGFLF
ncbi:MAG TPA: outer membrane beta-barrel protein [Geobacteraceae bacterium]